MSEVADACADTPQQKIDCRAGASPAKLLPWEQRLIYFVTICVANRERVLANETAFSAFKAATSKLENWSILAAMLMPDHLHVIVAPTESRNAKLGNFSGALKRWVRQELNASWEWQPGCFDRLL